MKYPFFVEPLSVEDGGGFVVTFPDLPGCMADGDSVEEAVVNAADALECWLEAQEDRGAQVDEPFASFKYAAESMEDFEGQIERRDDEIADLKAVVERLETELSLAKSSRSVVQARWAFERRPSSSGAIRNRA
ncbi:type II toxin-antitoxin system HicB family antitoxin [Rhodobacter sp. NTK016B]|uniref:type II toxin-antitoxin system HicB family antitoxin n=1 Tax=Rhodobacter sp. NTK016B TaxID=2759676 RepID=UPI001A8E41AC|nr:type II toxin-antitoxin system HicB family antitoxin [Rhodobacter sp. NTK016B]MBN8292849.1 type II toxin-antitoxin system HicB family antitoxin [Rhodobacter sp. NTK016B]